MMNNIVTMGLISTLASLFFSCREQVSPLSEDYFKKSGAIYFIPGGNGFERGSRKTVADINSFSVIEGVYARDKDHIYFMGCPQQLVDVKTFQLKNKVPIDQQHVFKFEGFASATSHCSKNQLSVIEKADPETYITLYDELQFLSKDKSSYFYHNQRIAVDYATFEVLNKNFVRDKHQLYLATQKTIHPLNYAVDQVHYINREYLILEDKTLLYYEPYQGTGILETKLTSANQIKSLDEKSLIIDDLVIIRGKPFAYQQVDANSFKILGSSGGNSFWSRDKNHIYYNQQLLVEADPNTFEILKLAVAKDANHIFVGNKIFYGPDVKSFRRVNKSSANYDFEDDLGNKYWYRTNKGQVVLAPVNKK